MTSATVEQLETYGPDQCRAMSVDEARLWCRRLAGGRYENFSVLSSLVPPDLRDGFAALYAFCRWADDLGDETGDTEKSLELLAWWRQELADCYAGNPRHPVFVALHPVIERHQLPAEPFGDLIGAFEQDQRVNRYETWDQLIDYCSRSADPVGRLVLMVCGEPRTETVFRHSDETCTALQLTNHWQDVRRDILDRDRIYLPREMIDIPDFEDRLRRSAVQGYGVDQEFLGQTRTLIRTCVERTWPMFESGEKLLDMLGPQTAPIVWLLGRGGQHVLRQIELWNYETALHRPKLSAFARVGLVAQAKWKARGWRHNGNGSA